MNLQEPNNYGMILWVSILTGALILVVWWASVDSGRISIIERKIDQIRSLAELDEKYVGEHHFALGPENFKELQKDGAIFTNTPSDEESQNKTRTLLMQIDVIERRISVLEHKTGFTSPETYSHITEGRENVHIGTIPAPPADQSGGEHGRKN